MVLVNPRGVAKTSVLERSPASWVARYGSVAFNQYGKDSPAGGVNEKGLVVEVMDLDETRYPPPDSRPAVGPLEWVQHLLDTSASVDEALRAAKRVRIGTLHRSIPARDARATRRQWNHQQPHGDASRRRAAATRARQRGYEDSRDYLPRPRARRCRVHRRLAQALRACGASFGRSRRGGGRSAQLQILDRVAAGRAVADRYDLPTTIHYHTATNRSVFIASRRELRCRSGGGCSTSTPGAAHTEALAFRGSRRPDAHGLRQTTPLPRDAPGGAREAQIEQRRCVARRRQLMR